MQKILIALIFLFATSICFADLKEIQHSGILRVGVTGDYQPFSWYDTYTNKFSGLDIDLAKNLANKLHLKVQFVKTSWPTLSNDLTGNKFDIAMGGISASPERAQLFLFSKPYVFDSKVAVIRCAERNKLTNLLAIDKVGIRVIENKGGTNEKFAKQNLKQAKLTIVESSINIFNYILNSKADVMFTDDSEAMFQHRLHPELCIIKLDTKSSPLTPKVILLPKDAINLQTAINQWLDQLQTSGNLHKIFVRWLG